MLEWLLNWGPCVACGWMLWIVGVAVWMQVDAEDDPDERELGGQRGGA